MSVIYIHIYSTHDDELVAVIGNAKSSIATPNRQVDLAECRLPPKAPLPWAAAAQETEMRSPVFTHFPKWPVVFSLLEKAVVCFFL